MALKSNSFEQPVEGTVSRVNDEVEVGEDLQFQRKWWRFENAAWVVFTLIIVLDLLGFFGRGPMAKAERRAGDGSFEVKYERIERTNSPSILTMQFAPQAVRNGEIRVFASQSLVEELGTQRIIPQPDSSIVGNGGLTYVFKVSGTPARVELALQPSLPGIFDFQIGIPGGSAVQSKVVVVP